MIERAEIEASESALCAALGLLHWCNTTMSPAEWSFLGATALWNAILLYTATPQGAVFDRRLCCAVCPIACVLYLALGQLALGGGACYGRAAIDTTSEDTEVAATVPCALFGALFAQSVVQCAVARARPAKGRVAEAAAWPCAGVQALTLLYYVVERSDAACLLTAPPFLSDVSGVTARPLHLVLWTCSVSAQVLAIYSVERELSARMPRPPPTNARRDCCAALVAVQVMCWCSALLDARAPGATSYGLALAALSCAAFYALLAKGVRGPLARGAAAARRGKDERIAAQLERAAVFFTVAWHGFPLVWGAGVLGAVGDARVRLGYVLCDVVAKFLPASIYVSLAVDP